MAKVRTLSEQARRFLGKTHGLFIDGRWRAAADEAHVLPSVDPATGEAMSRFAIAGPVEVDAAVGAARHTFECGRWRRLPQSTRARVLWKVGDLIEQNAQLLAELETIDGGKLFTAALHGDVDLAAEVFRYHAGWCTKLDGSRLDIQLGAGRFQCDTTHEPIGVAALIVPWNGPLAMSAWKLAPALAAGCSVIVKPSELSCLSVLKLAELLAEAGVPDGVVNVIPGSGAEAGAELASHRGVDKISFTGSTATGRQIVQAAAGNLKKLTLELGGKSPVIVFADADLDLAANGVASGIFGGAGQVCVAGSRLYVERPVYSEFVERLGAAASALRLGPGLDESSQMGPLISAAHRTRVSELVAQGVREGAHLVSGGRVVQGRGFFFEPTVLADMSPAMTPMREEIFGPVLSAAPFDGADEVIALANASELGLAGSVWTRDIGKALDTTARVRAGLLWVNTHGVPHPAVPFGGYKQSGWGREQGRQAVESFMELKSVMIRL